jgi:hypothetical protein
MPTIRSASLISAAIENCAGSIVIIGCRPWHVPGNLGGGRIRRVRLGLSAGDGRAVSRDVRDQLGRAHLGTRTFPTRDDSRNNFWLALLTLGEGWHNNHHHCRSSCRQGVLWWEIDLTYAGLRLLALLGIARDLRPFVEAPVRSATA